MHGMKEPTRLGFDRGECPQRESVAEGVDCSAQRNTLADGTANSDCGSAMIEANP